MFGLTLPARLVLFFCMLAGGVGTLVYIGWISEGLPGGRYPLWFFVLPAFTAAGGLALALLAVLRMCGVRIYRDQ